MATKTAPPPASDRAAVKQSAGEQILSNAQSSRLEIQDFVPLAHSLEWELGQQYLRERGNKAFISDASPVPFVINNDGTLSRNAATVFFESLLAAEKAGTLEPDLFVLELGIGVGLFARYFLDNFRDLCAQHKKDFYDRLTYIAADKSERMLLDVLRHGVLAHHPGRYRVRIVDALQPNVRLPGDVCFWKHEGRPFRAVFLNYLLDCLPAAVLQIDGDSTKELFVRTCLARNVRLEDFTDMKVEALKDRAISDDPATKQDLLEVYGLFASEYDYRTVDIKKLPYWEFLLEYRRHSKRVLHSYGAIQCLQRLLTLVRDDGFILINDYGQTMVSRDDEFEHQRFSLATFVGVNFPLLKAFFAEQQKLEWLEPSGESKGIHTRLLAHTSTPELRVVFNRMFSEQAHKDLQEPIMRARECAKVGRFELAATYYREALEKQPRNWVLANEISMFLTFSLRDPKAGSDMAKVALALNPTLSAELWNTLGDSLYEFGRTAEARSAYLKALDVNSTDVRSRYNLAWTYTREKNFPAALEMIAQALALDKTGEFRERLLQKQQEVLTHLAMRHQQEYLRIINLVSKYAKKEGTETGPTESQVIKHVQES